MHETKTGRESLQINANAENLEQSPATARKWDYELITREFPRIDDSLYLNTGSCGRKPQRVLTTLRESCERLNRNPTITTFLDQAPWQKAREAVARLLDVPESWVLLTQNTTQGLHLLMSSFLLDRGDEFLTTDHEHGSVKVLARYLEETRGIVVRIHKVEPDKGSGQFCQSMLNLVTDKTRLVLCSEISSYSAWRPDLSLLIESLGSRHIPLLVDGAHGPGQIICRPGRYPLWVGSGHKWLGGPNGTGIAVVQPDLVHKLSPVWLGDWYYERFDADRADLSRFEAQGTSDIARWDGLAAACELQSEVGGEDILARSFALAQYLRSQLAPLQPVFRTPSVDSNNACGIHDYRTAMVVFNFGDRRIPVADLRETLWQNHRIWVQPDFASQAPGQGIRISCHYSLSENDIDRFVKALTEIVGVHGRA